MASELTYEKQKLYELGGINVEIIREREQRSPVPVVHKAPETSSIDFFDSALEGLSEHNETPGSLSVSLPFEEDFVVDTAHIDGQYTSLELEIQK